MPSRTNSDIIRDLEKTAAIHQEVIDNLKKGLDRAEQSSIETANRQSQLSVLEHRVGELERHQQNRIGYFWMLLGILLGWGLSFASELLMKYIP